MLSKWPRTAAQAWQVRRTVPRLPETVGRLGHHGDGRADRHVVAIGDSVAAGVGVPRGEDTVAAQVAVRLSVPGASWAIHARGGLDARGVAALPDRPGVADDLAVADVVVVSVGVNDLKALHAMRRWRRDLGALLRRLVAAAPQARVVLVGMPPVALFPALPASLRDALGARAARMDRAGASVAAEHGVLHLPLAADLLEGGAAFATDGFHPSAGAHAMLADAVVALLEENRREEADAVR